MVRESKKSIQNERGSVDDRKKKRNIYKIGSQPKFQLIIEKWSKLILVLSWFL